MCFQEIAEDGVCCSVFRLIVLFGVQVRLAIGLSWTYLWVTCKPWLLGPNSPVLSLLHVRLTDPRALSHRDWRQPSLFAIVSSHCPIFLLKNQPPFRSFGPVFVGESVFGIITRILLPSFHSNVLMHTPSYISIQNCAVDQDSSAITQDKSPAVQKKLWTITKVLNFSWGEWDGYRGTELSLQEKADVSEGPWEAPLSQAVCSPHLNWIWLASRGL